MYSFEFISTVISKVYLSKWFVEYRDDSFPEINNVSKITDACYISYDRRLIRASIKRRFLARSTYMYTSRILWDRILRMIAYVDRFTRSFVCNFDVDKDYTTRGKKHSRRLVQEESFAFMTNGCCRDYLIVIGRQVPLIDAFLLTHEISRREIKQMIDNSLGILYGITCPISHV